jgi:hypothetical protein
VIKKQQFLFSLSFIILTSLIIATRFIDVGIDTKVYLTLYSNIHKPDFETYTEPGFLLIMKVFSLFGLHSSFWLFFLALLTNTFLIISGLKIFKYSFIKTYNNHLLFFFSMLLFSSWYLTLTTNGIRQGLAISILIYGVVSCLFDKNRKFLYLIYFPIALSFHYSILLFLPLVFLLHVNFKKVSIIFWVTAIGYPLGFNEILVKFLSDFFGIGVYELIKYFTITESEVGSGMYEGFDMRLYIYTLFWPTLLWLILKCNYKINLIRSKKYHFKELIKIYMLFGIPYFIFGFGPFANRYAMLCWMFIPFLQVLIFFSINITSRLITLYLLIFSFVFFILERFQWVCVITSTCSDNVIF